MLLDLDPAQLLGRWAKQSTGKRRVPLMVPDAGQITAGQHHVGQYAVANGTDLTAPSGEHPDFVGDTLWIKRGDGRFRRDGIPRQMVGVDKRRRKMNLSPGARPADLWIDRHRRPVNFIAS